MSRQTIDPEIKTAAIEDMRAGMYHSAVAEKYGISLVTVRVWKSAAGLVRTGEKQVRNNSQTAAMRKMMKGWKWVWTGNQ